MAKLPMHEVELSVDWFVGKTIFQIIPVCVNWKKKTQTQTKKQQEKGGNPLTSLPWSWVAFSVQCLDPFRASCAGVVYIYIGLCRGVQRDFWTNGLGSSKQRLWFGGSLHSSLFLLLGICMGGVPFNLTLLFNIWTSVPSVTAICQTYLCVCMCVRMCVHLNSKLTKMFID